MNQSWFREDLCTRCGDCFTRCRYLDLSRKQAVAEIERLIAGQPTKWVEKKCIGCMACDAFCPESARPHQLILERWHRRCQEQGLPVRAAYLLPYHEPNYRTGVISRMDPREQELLVRWKNQPAQGEVLYPGCNLLTLPYLFDLRVLDRLPVSGDWDLCCGEPLYRIGAFEAVEKIARGLTEYYAGKKISKMVFVCPACLNMFRNVLPKQFGAKLDFEGEYIAAWLLRKLDAGELEVKRPLGRTVTVHDSCHARIMGDEIMESTRELYRRLGLKIVEMKNHHQEGLCCGIGAGCSRQLPQDMMLASWRELHEGAGAGAGQTAVYCTGCYLVLNLTRNFVRSGPPLHHTLEFLGEAVGEPRPRRVESRAFAITYNVVTKAFPQLLSGKRYRIEQIKVASPGDPVQNKK